MTLQNITWWLGTIVCWLLGVAGYWGMNKLWLEPRWPKKALGLLLGFLGTIFILAGCTLSQYAR